MASGTENADVEMLRAIAHARMYVTSGRGLESVVHALVENRLGRVSAVLGPALQRMDLGEPAETAVRSVLDRENDAHMRSFLSALIAAGKPGLMRLDELSESLHSERESKAEIYGSRLTGIVDMTAALFVFSFAPTMLKVLEKIPDNPILPVIKLPWFFDDLFYGILAATLTALLVLARAR